MPLHGLASVARHRKMNAALCAALLLLPLAPRNVSAQQTPLPLPAFCDPDEVCIQLRVVTLVVNDDGGTEQGSDFTINVARRASSLSPSCCSRDELAARVARLLSMSLILFSSRLDR